MPKLNKFKTTIFLILFGNILQFQSLTYAKQFELVERKNKSAYSQYFENQNFEKISFDNYALTNSQDLNQLPNKNQENVKIENNNGPIVFFKILFSFCFVMILALFYVKRKINLKFEIKNKIAFFDGLAKQAEDYLSGRTKLKLKQVLTLIPGQNLYLVEINNKQLLVGSTPNGGVQFLADLSEENLIVDEKGECFLNSKPKKTDKDIKHFIPQEWKITNIEVPTTVLNSFEADIKHFEPKVETVPQESPFIESLPRRSLSIPELFQVDFEKNKRSNKANKKARNSMVKNPLKRKASFKDTLNPSEVIGY